MGSSNLQKESIYQPRRYTKLPYDIQLVDVQNQIAYFFLSSGGTRIGSFKISTDKFDELFTLNSSMPKTPAPIGIRAEYFAPFFSNIL